MKTKFERQEQLCVLGLNAPKYTRIETMKELKSTNLCAEETWSIRSMPIRELNLGERIELFDSLKARLPNAYLKNLNTNFPPNIFALHNDWCFDILKTLIESGLTPIICAGIDMTKCRFAGAALKYKDGSMIIEIAEGAVNVRRVTQEGKFDRQYTYHSRINWLYPEGRRHPDDNLIKQIAKKLGETPLENVIFEFSYYDVPVGSKKENIVIWDYLPRDKYDSAKSKLPNIQYNGKSEDDNI